MKKIITNSLLLIFCSIPRLIKAQTVLTRFTIANEDRLAATRSFKSVSYSPVNDLPIPEFIETETLSNEESPVSNAVAPDDIEKISLSQVKYAMMLDVEVESIKDTRLYMFIENWFGTRYKYGGKTKRGIDCSAFTDSLLSAVYNLFIPRTAREQYKNCERICKEDLLEGDLVFFNTRGGVSHVGVYLANGRFVHSSSSQGVMISSLADKYFSRKFIGAGRVRDKN